MAINPASRPDNLPVSSETRETSPNTPDSFPPVTAGVNKILRKMAKKIPTPMKAIGLK